MVAEVADVPPDHAEALGGKSAISDGPPSSPGAVFIPISVWLDKNELRGGDAWDEQIRKRIHARRIPMRETRVTFAWTGNRQFGD